MPATADGTDPKGDGYHKKSNRSTQQKQASQKEMAQLMRVWKLMEVTRMTTISSWRRGEVEAKGLREGKRPNILGLEGWTCEGRHDTSRRIEGGY